MAGAAVVASVVTVGSVATEASAAIADFVVMVDFVVIPGTAVTVGTATTISVPITTTVIASGGMDGSTAANKLRLSNRPRQHKPAGFLFARQPSAEAANPACTFLICVKASSDSGPLFTDDVACCNSSSVAMPISVVASAGLEMT